MNQRELTLAIARKFFLTQADSKRIIKFILAEMTKNLKKNKRVFLYGFGSFTKKKRKARKVRHPGTGKIITIPERTTVDFNPSASLLKDVR